MIKLILGVILFIFGIFAGLYVGLWWAFVGGIIQIIEGIVATPVVATSIAFGIVKIMFAGALGYLSAIACILPSLVLISKGLDKL
jgi:hypothetical protein